MTITKNILRQTTLITALLICCAMAGQEAYRAEGPAAAVQLRSNGLYDLTLCPNFGIEIQTDLGLAWQLDYVGAWWNSDSRHRYFSNYGFQTELRYYFSAKKQMMPYTGHHAGIYYQLATYDFEFGGTGYQCNDLKRSQGLGVSYGYSMPLSSRFSLDFTAGLGYFGSKYTVYEPSGDWYRPTSEKKLTWFGPTKLEVSIVWNINSKNDK